MRLAPHSRLGSYEILSPLGAGGMGEVYRARDERLGREVALKVLPEAYAQNPEWVRRFEREARLLASLNHPNIATIHGFESTGGVLFLVMEFIPGDTLGQILAAGSLSTTDALMIAGHIAGALEAAHDRDVIHRDLKPDNVKVTPSGVVKVLDFGLAKSLTDGVTSHVSQSPTSLHSATELGAVVGTAAYMSPEQARGRPVDRRSDIWAFGCVLYEMLCRCRLFHGETGSDSLAAVLRTEPDWNRLPVETPSKVRDLLERCLEKDPSRRLRDAHDIRLTIEHALAEPVTPVPAVATDRPHARRQAVLIGALAGMVLGALTTGLILWRASSPIPSTSPPVARFAITLPAGHELMGGNAIAVSPDGANVVYAALREGSPQLYLRRLDQLEPVPIPGTIGGTRPFFSPDGNWVGFLVGSTLKKIPLAGGDAVTLCAVKELRGASWGPRGIVFGLGEAKTLFSVSASGGIPVPLTPADGQQDDHIALWPSVLPGGQAVLYTAWSGSIGSSDLSVQALDTQERRVVLKGGANGRYTRTGHIVYVRSTGASGALWAVPFDRERLEVTGEPAPVVERVDVFPGGAALFALSEQGTLVHVAPPDPTPRRVLLVDRKGSTRPLGATLRDVRGPRVSPDGRLLALTVRDRNGWDIWTVDLERDTWSRVTSDPHADDFPIWSPDGAWLAYASDRSGASNIYRKRLDGREAEERITTSTVGQIPQGWSPDRQWLVYSNFPAGGYDIWTVSLVGTPKASLFLGTPFAERGGPFSPDGRFIAYTSDESGRVEIYVRRFPDMGVKWQISNGGGTQPVWAPDGRELFYRREGTLMAVDLGGSSEPNPGVPRMLFALDFAEPEISGPGHADYDITPDGRHFVFTERSQQRLTRGPLFIVLNWFDELTRRVPRP